MTGRESLFAADLPEGLRVYYCPICKVGTERSWHSLHDGGLFPQTATEHDCVRIDVSALIARLKEIKKLASDPFASESVALRACLLAANEALGLPGPEPSPEREIAREIIRAARQCRARRAHPLSSDYHVRCTLEAGHESDHALNDELSWAEDSPYALPEAES